MKDAKRGISALDPLMKILALSEKPDTYNKQLQNASMSLAPSSPHSDLSLLLEVFTS